MDPTCIYQNNMKTVTTEIFCGAEQHKQAQSIHTEKSDTQTLLQHYYRSTLKTQFSTFLKVKAKNRIVSTILTLYLSEIL